MGTSQKLLLPYPELTDEANVPGDMKELTDALDASMIYGGKAQSDLLDSYPNGVSVLTLTSGQGSSGGWPYAGSGTVLTVKRYDSSGSSVGFQIWTRTNTAAPEAQFRQGASGAWSSWVPMYFDTGWVNMSSAVTGITKYRVLNGVVSLQVDGSFNSTSGTTHTLTTAPLPAAYRPAVQARAAGYFAGFAGILTVDSGGNLTAVQNSGTGKASVSGIVIYPLG